MGESTRPLFEPTFNRSVKLRSSDERLSSDAGAILLREADDALGLTSSIGERLVDSRDPNRTRYKLTELLRERIYALALGYRSYDDLDRVAHDPAVKIAAWEQCGDRVLSERLASQPTFSRVLATLARKENREALREGLGDQISQHVRSGSSQHRIARGTIDVDSMPIDARGLQKGSAYNGYYRRRVFHPLLAAFSAEGHFQANRVGDGFVHAMLRKGNVSSAAGALRFIRNAVRKCSPFTQELDVRFDSAFTSGSVLDGLTEDGTRFLGLLPTNERLKRLAGPHLQRPVGRPPKEGYEKVIELGAYRGGTWKHAQRLLLVVIDTPDPKTGQLDFFPHYFFLVTNWRPEQRDGPRLLEHYRNRGTFEDRIGEFSQSVSANLSSDGFRANEVTFLLSLLAFNLGSILRGELESAFGTGWDLRRVQTTVLKAGARVVKKSRRLLVDVAAAVVPLWEPLLRAFERWRRRKDIAPSTRRPRRRGWRPPPAHAHLACVLRQ